MRTYNHLWEKLVSDENLSLAAKNAVKSKKSKASVKEFLAHRNEKLADLKARLESGTYKTSGYYIKQIFEPKRRLIYVLPLYPDHVMHHAIINILGPIWRGQFIRDSYACIPGRGLQMASQRVMCFIRRNKYVLQCDIRKFFPSMNHEVLLNIIGRKVHDSRFMSVIREIVNSIDGETNIPIGNLTSQWFGNVYLNELDHFVKQDLRWRDYIRYCDDFCLFGNSKDDLRMALNKIRDFLANKLRLNFSKSVVYPTARGVDFIGYRHFKKFILLRRRTSKRISHRIQTMMNSNCDEQLVMGRLSAAYGWAKWANTYNYRRNLCVMAHGSKYESLIKKHLLPKK